MRILVTFALLSWGTLGASALVGMLLAMVSWRRLGPVLSESFAGDGDYSPPLDRRSSVQRLSQALAGIAASVLTAAAATARLPAAAVLFAARTAREALTALGRALLWVAIVAANVGGAAVRRRGRRRSRMGPTAIGTRDLNVVFEVARPATAAFPLSATAATSAGQALGDVETVSASAPEPAWMEEPAWALAAAAPAVVPERQRPLEAPHAPASMMPLYLRTFRQHRPLFLLPVLLAVVFAGWFTLGEPKLYRSTTTLWADPVGGPPPETIGAPTAAAQEQAMLAELLTTQSFRTAVARGGPLAAHLERHPSEGWGLSALLAELRGSGALDDRIAAALGGRRATSTALGAHVLEIKLDAPSPTLAVGTLRALLTEFQAERAVRRSVALGAYRAEVAAATAALAEARTKLLDFTREHPSASRTNPMRALLATAERNADARLVDAKGALEQASSSPASASAQRSLRVVDPPTVPTAPTAGPKRVALGLVAGLFAGVLVSILGIVALTRSAVLVRPHTLQLTRAVEPKGQRRVKREGDAVVTGSFAKRRTRSR